MPILDYRDIAQTWMSAAGNNSNEFQLRDFASHSLEYLADDCIKSWDDETLDRAQLIEALADWKRQLENEDASQEDDYGSEGLNGRFEDSPRYRADMIDAGRGRLLR